MNEWLLKIELDGEWEECTFVTRKEALSAFAALAADYSRNLQRAILIAPGESLRTDEFDGPQRRVERPN